MFWAPIFSSSIKIAHSAELQLLMREIFMIIRIVWAEIYLFCSKISFIYIYKILLSDKIKKVYNILNWVNLEFISSFVYTDYIVYLLEW